MDWTKVQFGLRFRTELWQAYMRQHLHDGPIWALPKISAYLHVDSTDYFEQYMLHYVSYRRLTNTLGATRAQDDMSSPLLSLRGENP